MGVVVLDTTAVAAFVQPTDIFHEAADQALREHIGHDDVLVSVVTYSEILTGVGLGKHNRSFIDGFFDEVISDVIPLDMSVARIGAEIRARNKSLRLPDALIVATAEHCGADQIVTADKYWSKIRGITVTVKQLAAGRVRP